MNKLREPRAAYYALMLAGVLAPASVAQAQAPQQVAPPAASDEVVVTAQRRAQSILDVPVAVSAYDGEQLQQAQVQNLQDLQQIAPSLTVNFSNGSSTSSFILRGIGTSGTDVGLEQSVGVFIDGVYRGRPGAALVDLTEIERVEVLRGPQGALFGRNTSAGVISIITREPDFDFTSNVELTGGSDGIFIARARVSGPLIEDTLAVSLSGGFNRRDGFTRDIISGEDFDNVSRWNLRGQALWDITPNASLRVIADYTEENGECCTAPAVFRGPSGPAVGAVGGVLFPGVPGVAPSIPGPIEFAGTALDPFTRTVAINVAPDNSFKDYGVSAELNWDFGGTTLTLTGAWREFFNEQIFDADFTSAELFTNGVGRDITEWSGEVRLASNGDKRIDWIVGASLFDQEIDAEILSTLGADTFNYFNLLSQGGLAAARPALSLLNPAITPATLFAPTTFQLGSFDQEGSSWSVFGHADFELTDRLSIGGDIRYLQDDKSADFSHQTNDPFSQTVLRPPLPAPVIGALRGFQTFETFQPYSTSISDDAILGSASVVYQVREALNLYWRFARGYKAGGINLNFDAGGQIPGFPGLDNALGQGVNPEQALFDPETITAYELGLKGSFFKGRLRTSLALFLQNLQNYQVNTFDGEIGQFTLRNAAEVRSRGVELEYTYRPTERFTLSGALIFLDAEYLSFPDGPQVAVPSGLPPGTASPVQNLTGQPPIFSPDWTASGSATYALPLAAKTQLLFNANYRYRSGYFTALDNDPISFQDSNVFVDANVTLEIDGGRYALQMWVKNIGDVGVTNIVFDTPFQNGSYNAFLEPPRTFGGTLRWRY